ncbi:hypothetical protein [Parvibaculum sp.]|uniref:hypothetical protein n=1 Tax=Parvibaculum sp. TaxID=2024848 RepID=UPI00273150B7|nr:hypothetical protein [Parvibaculum sp.]MDP1628359.1 hypothetical protein [Parvibaculum sp.]MDP2149922.1 hypothetical protein [Parvibaculum sp.]MDP3329472.1 hypothetical protein [Parvibaculum sp.]
MTKNATAIKIIKAGIEAIAALTMNITIDQNGILISVTTTLFVPFSIASSPTVARLK